MDQVLFLSAWINQKHIKSYRHNFLFPLLIFMCFVYNFNNTFSVGIVFVKKTEGMWKDHVTWNQTFPTLG